MCAAFVIYKCVNCYRTFHLQLKVALQKTIWWRFCCCLLQLLLMRRGFFLPSGLVRKFLLHCQKGEIWSGHYYFYVFVFLKEFRNFFRCRPARALKINLRIQSSEFGKMDVLFSHCKLEFHCFELYPEIFAA